jgi:hypothetical protein
MRINREVDFHRVSGTSLQGTLYTNYSRIVELFGNPGCGVDYKTDAEWILEFVTEDGEREVATIYNWKNGKNYLGESGLAVEDITRWNIGGNSIRVEELVRRAVRHGIKAE